MTEHTPNTDTHSNVKTFNGDVNLDGTSTED